MPSSVTMPLKQIRDKGGNQHDADAACKPHIAFKLHPLPQARLRSHAVYLRLSHLS